MEEEKKLEIFRQSVIYRHFQYQILLKIRGYDIDEEKLNSEELEIDTELLGIRFINNDFIRLRDLEELRLLLCSVDPPENINNNIKHIVYQVEHTKLRMRAERNHARPHFHIEYKKEYNASYAIDTLERMAGDMPKKYEKVILKWASTRKNKLLDIWKSLQDGKDKDVERLIYEAQSG